VGAGPGGLSEADAVARIQQAGLRATYVNYFDQTTVPAAQKQALLSVKAGAVFQHADPVGQQLPRGSDYVIAVAAELVSGRSPLDHGILGVLADPSAIGEHSPMLLLNPTDRESPSRRGPNGLTPLPWHIVCLSCDGTWLQVDLGEIWPGAPYPLGASWDRRGVNFAIYAENAQRWTCAFSTVGTISSRRSKYAFPSRRTSSGMDSFRASS